MAVEQEVKLSDELSVMIAPLTALDSMQADDYMGESVSEVKANKIYAICSIRKVKGNADADFVAVSPLKNKIEFAAVAQRLSMGELMKLTMEVSKMTAATFDDTLKNELAALASRS